ncbi:hypothetical protein TanjilG_15359 [Lupinus angustifolius]|uniref:C2 NT-type domain-containing protein n=1 Tax=Lupinus angustifolius TaxID=3871 RepID=A0A1J7HNS1_LUPAN|nr:PREDICTED: uncharacterized protein LOC109344374 isoform X2 [Lupinus angustifolius]OIW14446.1 hypothetical protein TanjilG_15359 [Lupinus angustifolius]
MVIGTKGKYRGSGAIKIDYLIHIQEIKPWPPSQTLRSSRSVLIQWENGERSSGSTNLVSPSLGSVIGDGKIEFNESFRLAVTLLRDVSVKNSDTDAFQKNCLEFNLYEPRRDKSVKGQLLGTAIIDLADCGVLKETLSISAPLNCKRNYRNTDQPLLFVKIEPVEKNRTKSSLKDRLSKEVSKDNGDSVSALTNEEYNEEAEVASFTDDDVSSHSSVAAVISSPNSTGCMPREHEENEPGGPAQNNGRYDKNHPLASETTVEKMNLMQREANEKLESSSYMSSMDVCSSVEGPVNGHASMMNTPKSSSVATRKHVSRSADFSSSSLEENSKHGSTSRDHENLGQNSGTVNCGSSEINDKLNERPGEYDNYRVKEGESDKFYYNSIEDKHGSKVLHVENQIEDESVAQSVKEQVLLSSGRISLGGSDTGMKGNIPKSERLKHVKSVRSPPETARSIGSLGSNHHAEVNKNGILGDTQNGGVNIRSIDTSNAKIYTREERNATLDRKVEHLENKIKMLEGELREAAAIEAALYSVVAEHGSSMSKVHAPARRLSRLYLHTCKENLQARRSGAAKSAISGLVLVAKACGSDVPRLAFWLSNAIVLRTIISQTTKDVEPSNPPESSMRRKSEKGNGKIAQPLIWKGFSRRRSENTEVDYAGFSNWGDSNMFISALEKLEAWIFSRIVDSIWWQSLTPHMQLVDTNVAHKDMASSSPRKSYRRVSSSCDQDQGNLSLDIWKNAFREACERLCPVRAGGHECGCLPVLPRLIMEQCVTRLDVAMFNAILRDSADDIPTDPISDPISDPKVLPISPGKSSFGAGAQLKTAIGNWSRWLTDLFGMDENDSLEDKDDDGIDNNGESQSTSFKFFSFLNALSELLMLPKDMLLIASIRKEVCPMFHAPLIKKILDGFVPDEFCPDPIPTVVFEALDSQDDLEDVQESVNTFPCIAAPIVYSPPLATSIANIIGEIGSQSQLRRSRSSIVRKSYTSDDELDELNSPLSSILFSSFSSSSVSTQPNWKSIESREESAVRYELLRDVWMNSE